MPKMLLFLLPEDVQKMPNLNLPVTYQACVMAPDSDQCSCFRSNHGK